MPASTREVEGLQSLKKSEDPSEPPRISRASRTFLKDSASEGLLWRPHKAMTSKSEGSAAFLACWLLGRSQNHSVKAE
jgi:hypothetical protein